MQRLQSIKERALDCFRNGQLVQAKGFLVELCAAEKRDVEAWTLLAAINAQLGAVNEVAACCREIVALRPDDGAGHFNLGVAYQTLGLNDKAVKSYLQVLRIQPGYAPAMTNLGFVLLSLQDIDAAGGYFKQALAIDPANAHAYNGQGLVFKQQGQLPEARANFERACGINAGLTEAHYNLGLTYVALGENAKAAESFEIALRCKPDYVEALLELGNALVAMGKYAGAEANLLRATMLRPDFAAAHFQLGHAYYLQDKNAEALSSYRQVLALEPNNFSALNNCGRIFERTGAFEEAVKHFKLALAGKYDSQIICNIGHVFLTQRDWSSAATYYREAIAYTPNAFEGHMGLGQACCELGFIEEAKQCFRRVIELKPELRIAKYFLASLENKALTDVAVADYVEGLFDDYAPKFDADLVEKLRYRTPGLLRDLIGTLMENAAARFEVLDLGCGTGLCGPLFRDIALRLDGVDLSSRMVEKARERALYDELHVGDITTVMGALERQYDLILAADVFVYIGDLTPVFESATAILRCGGLFAFSVEQLTGSGYRVLSSGRQAHSDQYIVELRHQFALTSVASRACELRLENGKPVTGMIHVLRKD